MWFYVWFLVYFSYFVHDETKQLVQRGTVATQSKKRKKKKEKEKKKKRKRKKKNICMALCHVSVVLHVDTFPSTQVHTSTEKSIQTELAHVLQQNNAHSMGR